MVDFESPGVLAGQSVGIDRRRLDCERPMSSRRSSHGCALYGSAHSANAAQTMSTHGIRQRFIGISKVTPPSSIELILNLELTGYEIIRD